MTSPGVTALYHANLTGEPVKARTPIAHKEHRRSVSDVHLGIAYARKDNYVHELPPPGSGKKSLFFAFNTGFRVGRQIGSVEEAFKRVWTDDTTSSADSPPSCTKMVRFTEPRA